MASQGWCADRFMDWVKNPNKGAKYAKEKLEGDYGIKLKYSKAWKVLRKFSAIVQLESTDRNEFSWKHCRDRVRREEEEVLQEDFCSLEAMY